MADLTPIPRRPPLSEVAYEQIRDQILRGDIKPGQALPAERALSEALGVNRGAIREAIKRLQQAQLVSVQQGGQARVLDYLDSTSIDMLHLLMVTPDGRPNIENLRSTNELRHAIAGPVAALAAERGGAELADRLDALVDEMRSADGDVEALQELSFAFSTCLILATRNLAFRILFNSLRKIFELTRGIFAQVLVDEYSDIESHAAIARAVRAGDTQAARRGAETLSHRSDARADEAIRALEAATAAPPQSSPA